MYCLFEHADEREANHMKFVASIFGVKVDGGGDDMNKNTKEGGFIPFGAPEDYEKMSDAEKTELTARMKNSHKSRLAPGKIHPAIKKGKVSFR